MGSQIIKNGISVDAQLRSVVTRTPNLNDDGKEPVLDLSVSVDDAAVRQQVDGFDGLERPFALVPVHDGDGVAWKRFDLDYTGTSMTGFISLRPVDQYEDPIRGIDPALIAQDGIALGMDTNEGTLWAQAPGENFQVKPESDET